jgi:hypothetical protein
MVTACDPLNDPLAGESEGVALVTDETVVELVFPVQTGV